MAPSSRSHPPPCPQATPRPASALCRQPDGLDELPVPYCGAHHPHMQEAYYTHNDMPPEQPHIVEHLNEYQDLTAGQAVPMAQCAASQGYPYENHQAPPGLQNHLLGCSVQAEEDEGMWVEGDHLKHHPGLRKLQSHLAIAEASCYQTCSIQFDPPLQLCTQKCKARLQRTLQLAFLQGTVQTRNTCSKETSAKFLHPYQSCALAADMMSYSKVAYTQV